MKISWKWIFEIFGISPGPKEWKIVDSVRRELPLSGIEIASVKSLGDSLESVIVAKVLEVTKHPQADRLNVCKVNDGQNTLQIVCGASNVRAGLTIALAPAGSKLPGGLEIRAAKIRGVDSQGMICSESELGLSESSEGILELPDALVVGQKFLDAVEVRDEIWELELTPDRSDCLSILGMARELRRYFPVKEGDTIAWPPVCVPDHDDFTKDNNSDVPVVKVEVMAKTACPLYGAQLFESFSRTNYSRLLQDRLSALGVERLRHPVVDLTNYVLFELGHPMHAFDADQIVGAKIIVRFAKAGERILTIDNVERELHPEDLVIADMERPIAIAGVMGSKDSAVTEKTQRVLLESAFFDPEVVRASAKRHKISSEAGHRFERGVNPLGVLEGAGRISSLFRSQLGAKRRGSFVLSKAEKAEKLFEPRFVNLDLRQIQRSLGFEISAVDALAALHCTGINCQSKSSNVITVEVPPYRWDLHREIDLVEEIARVHGFDKIPTRYPVQRQSFAGVASPIFDLVQDLRRIGLGAAYVEVAPYAFVSEKERELFSPSLSLQQLENPISDDWKYMRGSLHPGLFSNLSRHGSLRQKSVQIFEVGTVFERRSGDPGLRETNLKTSEYLHVGWALMGLRESPSWFQDKSSKTRDEYRNYFDAKGMWDSLWDHLSAIDGRWKNIELRGLWEFPQNEWSKVPPWIPVQALHPGRSGLIYVPALKTYRGFVGELHPGLLSRVMNFPAGWKFPVAVGEVRVIEDLWNWKSRDELRAKLGLQGRRRRVQAPASTPVVERDLSFAMARELRFEELRRTIKKAAPDLKELSCVDVFPLDDGKKSITFRLLLQAQDRSLGEEDIDKNLKAVVQDLAKIGANLRG